MHPAYYHKATLLTNADDFENARKNYETAIDIDENYTESYYSLGKLLSGGVATNKDGSIVDKTNLPESKDCFKKVIQLSPNHVKAHYNLAKILLTEQNLSLSKTHLLKAIKIDPQYSKAHYLIGTYMRKVKILN